MKFSHNSNKIIKIIVCYEKGCSGETIATEQIYTQLAENNHIRLKTYSAKPLSKTGFLSYFSWIFGSIVRWISVIIKVKNIDWVYTTTYTAGVASFFLKLFRKHKVCFHFHGSRLPEKYISGGLKVRLTQWIKIYSTLLMHKIFLINVDLVITPSSYARNQLIKDFPFLKAEKIVIIPNGVNIQRFRPLTTSLRLRLRKKYNINSNIKVVMYTGLLHKRKNVHLLIESFYRLNKRNKNSLLLIIHFKPKTKEELLYKTKLEKLAFKLKIDNKIRWIVNPKRIHHFYNIADIAVLLSRQEYFPLTLLEAIACRTIFLSSPVGGVEEILNKIDSRLIIKSSNSQKISEQLNSILKLTGVERKAILDKGYRFTQIYSWEKTSKAIYHELRSPY